jgi:MYXO-CTERM domain-containing protein
MTCPPVSLRRYAFSVALVAAFALPALAVPSGAHAEGVELVDQNGELVRVPPKPGYDIQSEHVSKILYLNRCAGGCTITPGQNDSRYNTSTIVAGPSQISAWQYGDDSWQELVSCVKELYAPYDLEVTDVDPGDNIFHHEAIVAGTYPEIGYETPIGGVAPSQCFPANNVISFTFANGYGNNPIAICHTVGQETAHSYGLEHARDCSDPMTYMQTCTRQFFRDRTTPCGEYQDEAQCQCGGSAQNSHRWLQTVLGESDVAVAGPDVNLQSPAEGEAVTNGFKVAATATHVRGIGTVELFLNGTSYGVQEAHSYSTASSPYWFDTPTDLPDGIIDVEIHATNDIGNETIVAMTVQKGEPCTSEATCLDGQSCEEGRCSFPPSDGEFGDACVSDTECASGLCPKEGDQGVCSMDCFPTTTEETCPSGYDCVAVNASNGFCWPEEKPTGCGCQSTGQEGPTGALLLLIGLWACTRRRRA